MFEPLNRVIINFHGLGPMPEQADGVKVWCADAALYADLLDETREVARAEGLEPLITFDDGNLSDLEVGLKPLAERGMKAIFFPCAGRIGKQGYLGESALRELAAAGMEIGSHGWSHTDWRRASPEVMRQEVSDAKDRIEQAANAPVATAAIPFGSYDRRVLKEASVFRTVFTSDAALADAEAWLQPRFSYLRSWSRGSVRRAIADSKRPARQLRQKLAMTLKRFR